MLVLKFTGLVYLAVATRCTMDHIQLQQDYCAKTKYCEEGTHVMCMYYDPVKVMGRACSDNAAEVTVTHSLKNLLLDIFNEIRKMVARGEEVGKYNRTLPKAYGLKRLQWDDKLAQFAQVFANQCSLKRDLCRATENFHYPGQFTGVNVFKHPDWQISDLNKKGLADDNVVSAIKNILKRAYNPKKMVTKELIKKYPNFLNSRTKDGTKDVTDAATILKHNILKTKPYLNIVHGSTSHIGCGISAYVSRGSFKDPADDAIYNIVELTCNFSAEPVPELPVYETDPPRRPGWTSICGCPPGFREDEDCLCVDHGLRSGQSDKGQASRVISMLKSLAQGEEQLYKKDSVRPESLSHRSNSRYNSYEILDNRTVLLNPDDTNLQAKVPSLKEKMLNKQLSPMRKPIDRRYNTGIVISQKMDLGKFGDGIRIGYQDRTINKVPAQIHRHSRSPKPQPKRPDSIFTRVSKFELPVQNKNTHQSNWAGGCIPSRNPVSSNTFYRVTPRKDFSNMNELVNEYVNNKRRRLSVPPPIAYVTQTRKVKNEDHVVQSTTPNYNKLKTPDLKTEEKYSQLLNLLNKLEIEVIYNELNIHMKEIFDKKIRKIYSIVFGDPKVTVDLVDSDLVDSLIKILNSKSHDRTSDSDIDFTSLFKNNREYSMHQDRSKFENISPDSDKNGDIYDSFYRDDKTSLDDKLDEYYKSKGEFQPSNPSTLEMMQKYAIRSDDDVLGAKRRKFYQEKLESLKNKLEKMRGHTSRKYERNRSHHTHRPHIESQENLNLRTRSHVGNFHNSGRTPLLTGFESE